MAPVQAWRGVMVFLPLIIIKSEALNDAIKNPLLITSRN